MPTALNFSPFLSLGAEALYFVTILIFVGFSLILWYHIKQYSLNPVKGTAYFIAYLLGSAFLIILMTAALWLL